MAEVLTLGGNKINWNRPPKPTDRVMWSKRCWTGKKGVKGKRVTGSLRTIAHIDRLNNLAKAKFGVEIEIIQPPFNTGVAASAHTHDLDCCFDWFIPGVPWWDQQAFGRRNGCGCWYRHPPLFGNHLHGFTLPPREGRSISDDFIVHGFQVGSYVDGGISTNRARRQVTSSQIEDYYNHAFGLSNQHRPGSDKSWFPADIEATIFDLDAYIKRRQRKAAA